MLEPIEKHLRPNERLHPAADLVVRGWPLTIDGLLRNADATRSRFSWWRTVHRHLGRGDRRRVEPRCHPGQSEAAHQESVRLGAMAAVQAAHFELLARFVAPHYSKVLPTYTEEVSSGFSKCSVSRCPTRTSQEEGDDEA
jgi:hypothetical protein